MTTFPIKPLRPHLRKVGAVSELTALSEVGGAKGSVKLFDWGVVVVGWGERREMSVSSALL